MTRPDTRTGRRRRERWTGALASVCLAVGAAGAAVAVPGLATAASTTASAPVTAVRVAPATDPVGDGAPEPPTDPPAPTEPVPTSAPPTGPPPTETPPPTTTTPDPLPTVTVTSVPAGPTPTRTATPRPTTPTTPGPPTPGGTQPAPARLGVRVTTGDVHLPVRYWNRASTPATLQVTVTNTGEVTGRLGLAYTLPAGVTDAGTPGCSPAGERTYRCGTWTAEPGARFSTLVQVRVSGDAWRRMPLGGTVTVTATAPGETGQARDDEGFAVLFPPGPPVPGIGLAADEVAFDISGGPSTLVVRLGNTGTVDATGSVEVVLPDGVSVSAPPQGCAPGTAGRTRCAVGTVPTGRSAVLRLTVVATPQAQRLAPLAGGVVGQLVPRHGPSRRVQMSFRITAAAALTSPVAGAPQPTGSQGVIAGAGRAATSDGGSGSVRRTAIVLIVASVLLVALALVLATASLRRGFTGQPGEATGDTGTTK